MHFSLRTFWKRYTAFFKTMKRGGKTKKETGNAVVESGTPCDPKQTISKSNRCYQEKKKFVIEWNDYVLVYFSYQDVLLTITLKTDN